MKSLTFTRLLTWILIILLNPLSVHAEKLSVGLQAYPPYSSTEYEGLSQEMMRMAFETQGVNVEFVFFPFARVKKLFLNKNLPFIVDVPSNYPSEKKFQTVPMFNVLSILVYNSENHQDLSFTSLEDFAGMTVGTLIGDSRISDFFKSFGLIVETTSNMEFNLRKLYAKRIDLADSAYLTALFLRKKLFPDGENKLVIIPKPVVPPLETGLMYFKNEKTNIMAQKFAKGMKRIRKSGDYSRLLEKYYGDVPKQVFIWD